MPARAMLVRAARQPEGTAQPVKIVFTVLLVITSLLLVLLILLHKGKGGGLSDMFGGGISSSLGGSSIAERNLDRITIAIGIVWAASIIGLGLLAKAAV
ncbi:MAG TPA: preprotein translocase subunit SecG [Jiangellaceae bacterium]|nr:preprotein translocase subunit SecG [Jiangellaceae bacterium]